MLTVFLFRGNCFMFISLIYCNPMSILILINSDSTYQAYGQITGERSGSLKFLAERSSILSMFEKELKDLS